MTHLTETTPADRAGRSVPAFCAACDFSRATFYNLMRDLPLELRPRSLKLGKRRIIIEAPAEYLSRLAAAQEAA